MGTKTIWSKALTIFRLVIPWVAVVVSSWRYCRGRAISAMRPTTRLRLISSGLWTLLGLLVFQCWRLVMDT